ncbi:MAG: preprotein translocase subunit SecE [Candidatus Dependentiae bacterium]|nr:preprotein translocase subunit SecE [Candidatus Dependentiae bacterium]
MKNLNTFFGEVRVELSKVVWPSRSEFLGAVVVVLITMVAFAIFLGLINYVFYTGILRIFQFLVFGR